MVGTTDLCCMASILSHHRDQTAALGRTLAPTLPRGTVLALSGDLGAGKTCFTKGLAEGLGIEGDITSPTFTLVHEHPDGRLPLYHIDLYRLEDESELESIALDDYLHSDGVTVVEWADKFADRMPSGVRWVKFRILEGDDREITL